jgi:hypothetical protein
MIRRWTNGSGKQLVGPVAAWSISIQESANVILSFLAPVPSGGDHVNAIQEVKRNATARELFALLRH